MIKIFENTPFRRDKNLVKAYNSFMELLPDDDSWALFKDADAMWLTPFYGNIIEDCIKQNSHISCFTAITNRIAPPMLKDTSYSGDDIVIHRRLAEDIYNKNGYEVEIFSPTERWKMSGMCFALKKSAWKDINGFRARYAHTKILGVDNQLHLDLHEKGHKVGIMKGLYIYHWYRGGNKKDISHLE